MAKVTREDLSRDLELAAEFRPFQEIDVHAKVAGYLKSISVDVGDHVREGQLIAVLEVPEMVQELAQASATEKRSELDVARAKSEVTRADSALRIRQVTYERIASVARSRPNLIAQQEIDDSEAKLREAEAQLATARATLAATEEQVRVSGAGRERVGAMMTYLRITAPFTGIVTKRYADKGAMIQAGTASQTQAMPVIRLSQTDHLRLVLPVPESIVSRVKVGAPVEVRVDSLSRVFQGKVARATNRLESATRTMLTEVDLPNPGYVLKPGMYAYATLTLDRREDAVAVPVQGLTSTDTAGNTRQAAVVNSKKEVEFRTVRIGIETPDKVEVLSGLEEGDLVVIGNRGQWKQGQQVEPKIAQVLHREGR